MLHAGAACNAGFRACAFVEIVVLALGAFFVLVDAGVIVNGKDVWNMNAGGTWHAVPAAGAGNQDAFAVQDSCFRNGVKIRFGERDNAGKGFEVIRHLFFGAHAGEDDLDAVLLGAPAQRPGSRRPIWVERLKMRADFLRRVCKAAAFDRLHHNDGDAFFLGESAALDTSLVLIVHVIELNLTEIPVIGVDDFFKNRIVVMERKPDVADKAFGFEIIKDFKDAYALVLFPALGIEGVQ